MDDLAVAAVTTTKADEVITEISDLFEVKRLGLLKQFLGLEIVRNRPGRRIYVHQNTYTEKIINKFMPGKLNAVKSPWPQKLEISADWKSSKAIMSPKEWLQRTESLNYLSMGTRPDITYTVQKLSEANMNSSEHHDRVLKHLFRYLYGTKTLALCLGGKYGIHDMNLRVYADASFADDKATRCSTAGHVVMLADGPIFWKSKRQTLVTTSTTEAEFINMTPAGQSLIWFDSILEQLGLQQPRPLLMFTVRTHRTPC